MERFLKSLIGTGVSACCVLAISGCARQQQTAPQVAPPATQATTSTTQPVPMAQVRYTSHDFIGKWKCTETNGKVVVIATSTIKANGTTEGYGTAYGHTTATYQNSWSYASTGPQTGTMSANNMAFPPPHYSSTAAVTWKSPNHFTMVTLTDTPNVKAIGSRTDCIRQ